MFEFENERSELVEKIEEFIRRKQYAALRDLLSPIEAADIALLMENLPEEDLPLLFRLLPKGLAAAVFVELDSDEQELLIQGFSNTELKEVLDELYLDDAVDIVEEMPANVVKRILKHSDPDMRKSINEILKYPDDSAGSIMTTEFVDLKTSMTVEDAFKRIRRTGPDKETINICYVIADNRNLIGLVTIRTLLLAEEDAVIGDIMGPFASAAGAFLPLYPIYRPFFSKHKVLRNIFRQFFWPLSRRTVCSFTAYDIRTGAIFVAPVDKGGYLP